MMTFDRVSTAARLAWFHRFPPPYGVRGRPRGDDVSRPHPRAFASLRLLAPLSLNERGVASGRL